MAISRVKLPDNSVQDIHDSRLPSVYPRIYVGTCPTAAATAAKVVTTEEFPLVNGNPVVGTTIAVKFTNTNSGASPTLNVNGTGAHSIFYSNAVYTSSSNIAGAAGRYTYYVWDGTYWVWLNNGTDNNDNTLAYNVRYNAGTRVVTDHTARYRILFSSADDQKWVPANTGTSTNATSSRTVNQTKINPFGQIVYYASTTILETGGTAGATTLYTQYNLTFGYSFNRTGAALTLTTKEPIYIKCAPQTDGSAIIDADTPYVQALPSTDDGKIYIYLGLASSATAVELSIVHPVYYYKDGQIRLWTNGASADISGKQDKWAEVGTRGSITTLTPTSTGGAIAIVDGEQAIGLGYMHFVEGQDLPDAYTLGIDSNGLKVEALDDNGGSYFTFNSSGLAMHNTSVTGLPTPTDNDEAATKGYVDSAITGIVVNGGYEGYIVIKVDRDSTLFFIINKDSADVCSIIANIKYDGINSPTAYLTSLNGNYTQCVQGGNGYIYWEDDGTDGIYYLILPLTLDSTHVRIIPLGSSVIPQVTVETTTPGELETTCPIVSIPTSLSQLSADSTHRLVTDAEKATWNSKADVFIAEYNVTTIAQIITAYNAGKKIIVYSDEDPDYSYLALSSINPTDQYADFSGIAVNSNESCVFKLTVNSDGWDSQYSPAIPTSTEKSTWNAKYTKPSTGIPASDLAAGVIPSVPVQDVTVGGTSVVSGGTAVIPAIPTELGDLSDIFVAVYGTTTSSEVAAAITAGKVVVLERNNLLYLYSQTLNGSSYYFVRPMTGALNYAILSNNTWSASTQYLVKATSAKDVTTTVNSSSTDAQVPTAKAVYDALPDLSDYALATGDDSYNFIVGSLQIPTGPDATTYAAVSYFNGHLTLTTQNGMMSIIKTVATTDDIPEISTNVVTDKASDTKTSSPKSVYDEIHPATQSSQPAGGFLPNVVYNLGTLSGNTTFALATPVDSSVANHYYWTFDTGSTAPTITWPASITGWNGGSAPTINASKHYEISVLNGIGAFMEV